MIDEAGSLVKLRAYQLPPELKELEEKIKEIEEKKEEAANEQDYEKAARLRDEELRLRVKLENLKANSSTLLASGAKSISPEWLPRVICPIMALRTFSE